MHPEDEPDDTAGDTLASARHPEYPPDDTGRDPPVTTGHPEDGPDGNPTETTGARADHQPQNLATHIQEHENVEKAAQDRADAAVEKMRQETERTYHLEFDRAIREIRSDQNRNFNQKLDEAIGQFRETLEGLAREYSGKLQDLETGNRENQEQHDRLMGQLQSEIDRNQEEAAQHREELDKAPVGGTQQQPRRPGGNRRNSSSSTGRSVPTPPRTWPRSWTKRSERTPEI